MKIIFFYVSIMLAVARAQVPLEQVWNISAPTLFADGLSCNLIYTVSDFITSDKVSFSVWDEGCQEGEVLADSFLSGELVSPLLDDPELDGLGTRSVNIKVVADPETFAFAPENIYSQNDGQARATLSFCVRASTTTPQPNEIEINFIETVVTVEYDLTDGFEILSIDQEKKQKKEKKGKEDFAPRGHWCDNNGNTITKAEAKLLGMGHKGSELSVCVHPNEKAKQFGLGVLSVDSFIWIRTDPVTGGMVEQAAVVDGKPPGNGLTRMECNGKGCTFKSILTAQFFAENIIPPTEAPTQAPTPNPTDPLTSIQEEPFFPNPTDPLTSIPEEQDLAIYRLSSPEYMRVAECPDCGTLGTDNGEGPEKAFDDNLNTQWVSQQASNSSLTYFFEGNTQFYSELMSYSVTSGGNRPQLDPMSWNIDAFDFDSMSWVNLASQTADFSNRAEKKEFSLGYWGNFWAIRMTVTSIRDDRQPSEPLPMVQISDFSLVGALQYPNSYSGAADYGLVGAAYDCDDCNNPQLAEGPQAAFDNSDSTKWVSTKGPGSSLKYQFNDFSTDHVFVRYDITSGNGFEERDPKKWEVWVQNELGVWVRVHEVTGFHFTQRQQRKTFFLKTPWTGRMQAIEIRISDTRGQHSDDPQKYTQIADVQIFRFPPHSIDRQLEKVGNPAENGHPNPIREIPNSVRDSGKPLNEPRKLEEIQGFSGYGTATVGFPRRRGLRGEEEILKMQVPFRMLQEEGISGDISRMLQEEGISGDISLTMELDPNPLDLSEGVVVACWWVFVAATSATLALLC